MAELIERSSGLVVKYKHSIAHDDEDIDAREDV